MRPTLQIYTFAPILIGINILIFHRQYFRPFLAVGLFLFALTGLVSAQNARMASLNDLELLLKGESEKALVINFWATWCRPCVAEIPFFEKLSVDAEKNNLHVVLINIDGEKDYHKLLLPFLKKRKMTAETWLLTEPNANLWIDKVSPDWGGSIPVTLVILPGGTERVFAEKDFESQEDLNTHLSLILKRDIQ